MTTTNAPDRYRIDGPGTKDPFAREFNAIVNAIRFCDLAAGEREARRVLAEIKTRGSRLGTDDRLKALGRAHNFLGEIAGMRGDLTTLVVEFNRALEAFGGTTIAGSRSRSWRGFAQAYLLIDFPGMALGCARNARLLVPSIDREATRLRAQYECDWLLALTLTAHGMFPNAETYAKSVDSLKDQMTHDDWLPGLADMASGRLDVERARRGLGDEHLEGGIARLRAAAGHYESVRLRWWEAVSREMLGRALESVDRGEAAVEMERAFAVFRKMGAQHHIEKAGQWLESHRRYERGRARGMVVDQPTVPAHVLRPDDVRVGKTMVTGPATRDVVRTLYRLAPAKLPVLIIGESGTGKDSLARILHSESGRKGQFTKFDCTSVPATLADDILFGHRKGAYTGAQMASAGVFEAADGGTVFLDEIGDLPLELQGKLLNIVEYGTFKRLGETVERTCSVRVVAATNRNLEEDVKAGRFRRDLLYRLAASPVYLVPLRERMDEAYHLAKLKARESGLEIEEAALEVIMGHTWPGNVRELMNAVEAAANEAVALGDALITRELVERVIRQTEAPGRPRRIPPSHADVASPLDTSPESGVAPMPDPVEEICTVDDAPGSSPDLAAPPEADETSTAGALAGGDLPAEPGSDERAALEAPSAGEIFDAAEADRTEDIRAAGETVATLIEEPSGAPDLASPAAHAKTASSEEAAASDGTAVTHTGPIIESPPDTTTGNDRRTSPARKPKRSKTTRPALAPELRQLASLLADSGATTETIAEFAACARPSAEAYEAIERLTDGADLTLETRAELFETIRAAFGPVVAIICSTPRPVAPPSPPAYPFLTENGWIAGSLNDARRTFERFYIESALEMTNYNRTRAAHLLGLSRGTYTGLQTLTAKIVKLGIELPADSAPRTVVEEVRHEHARS